MDQRKADIGQQIAQRPVLITQQPDTDAAGDKFLRKGDEDKIIEQRVDHRIAVRLFGKGPGHDPQKHGRERRGGDAPGLSAQAEKHGVRKILFQQYEKAEKKKNGNQ